MFHAKGRSIAISPFRRLVIDLMYFSGKVPSVTIERRMKLGPLLDVRARCSDRPSWTGIFTKAFAFVAARYPELRQAYMSLPWPRLYENHKNIATLNIGRQQGEEAVVLYALIRRPENRSLRQIDDIIRGYKDRALEEIDSYRNARRLASLPRLVRRLVWWLTLNLSGRRRCHNFGTFGITTVAAEGAGVQRILPLLTATIHYGLFDETGALNMYLSFDHRVLDGVTAARALADMERVLHRQIADEIAQLAGAGRQAA